MKPWTLALLQIVALTSGCLATHASAMQSPTATASLISDTNATVTAPSIHYGLLGPATTKNATLSYYVSADAPVSVSLRVNGTTLATQTVDGNQSWPIPLHYGRQNLTVSMVAHDLTLMDARTLVRLGRTNLTVDYGRYHPAHTGTATKDRLEVWIDVDARPSEAQYTAQHAKHIDAYTAHDQLAEFTTLTKKPVEVAWSASIGQFSVSKIDGAGNPLSSSAPPYWLYTVNNVDGNGISIQTLKPGDDVVWTLTPAN